MPELEPPPCVVTVAHGEAHGLPHELRAAGLPHLESDAYCQGAPAHENLPLCSCLEDSLRSQRVEAPGELGSQSEWLLVQIEECFRTGPCSDPRVLEEGYPTISNQERQ